MGPTPRKGAGWCALFLIALPAFSAEWYETTPFRANDPFQFDSQRSVLFPNTGLTLAGHPATGLLYATLPPATMAEIQKRPNHLIVVDSHTLSPQEATSYKGIFKQHAEAAQIPWIIGAIGSLPTAISSAISATVTLLDGVQRLGSANQKISSVALAELMAAGGRFDLAYSVVPDPASPTHRYVNSTVVYFVNVNREARSYIICSSTFALKP